MSAGPGPAGMQREGWFAWWPVAAVAVVGVVVTLTLVAFQRSLESERQNALLEREARTLTEAVANRLQLVEERLGSVRSLFSTVGILDQKQFAEFVQSLLEQRLAVETIEWLPRVDAADRARFEGGSIVIMEKSKDGTGLQPAAERPDYFPVRFVEPFIASAPEAGRDFGSEKRWREALEQARDRGKIVAIGLNPAGDSHSSGGLLVLMPVYAVSASTDTVEQRRAALRGLVLGVVRLEPLVRLAAASGLERFAISLQTVEHSSLGAGVSIRTGDANGSLKDARVHPGAFGTRISFAGREFDLHAVPAPATTRLPFTRESIFVLAIGIVATLASALVAYLLHAGNRRVVKLVAERTRDLKESQSELQVSQERLQLALISAKMWAWDWDVASDALVWLDPPEPLLGPRPADGWPDFRAMVHPEDYPAFLSAGHASLAKGVPYHCEFRIRRTDGAEAWVAASGAVIREASGKPARMIGISLDFTAHKAAEALLNQALQAAEQASRTKSEFLATMSHEIRTPMNGVLGMAELLKTTALDEEQRDYVRILQESGNSLLSLLNDILDFSKIESGHLDLHPVPFVVAELVIEVKQLMSGRAREKNVDLRVEVSPALPPQLIGDHTRIRQVLANLVGNGVKFTEAGSVTISLVPTVSGNIRFEVRDTGIGIPEDVVGRLFQPFTQADSSITRRFGGTGLGLAICKRLIDAMGGSIGVESTAGAGSCFWFELPLLVATVSTAVADEIAGQPAWPGRRVLVVEDNRVNAAVVASLLEHRAIAVSHVEDGAAAVACAFDGFDLVLMDIQMPVMDGLTATRQIRSAEPPGRHLPILALTANAFEEDRRTALEAGMDDFLTKPLTVDELNHALTRWLGEPSGTVAG